MHVRLTNSDMSYVETVQKHFAELQPLPIEVGASDVVRLGLRELMAKLGHEVGEVDEIVGDAVAPNRSSPTTEIIAAVVEIFAECDNHPMSAVEILPLLQNRGITVAGQNPAGNLSSKLSSTATGPMAQLKSNGPRGGYQLADHNAIARGLSLGTNNPI